MEPRIETMTGEAMQDAQARESLAGLMGGGTDCEIILNDGNIIYTDEISALSLYRAGYMLIKGSLHQPDM